MAAADSTQKKRNNYKLLVDPELKKGAKKVYRLNGRDVPGFPSDSHPKDPRTQKTVLGVTGSCADLKLPRFKFDSFWEGPPPDRDVFVIGLNDGARGTLFREACVEIDPIHSIKFHRHPKTKSFLGAATVCFARSGAGQKALSQLDGKIVGGCYLRAELDDSGDHLKQYLEPVLRKCVLDKKQQSHTQRDSKDWTNSSTVDCSDSEDNRTQRDSVSECNVDLSESEPDPSTSANTPLTPTVPKKDSDPFAIPSSSTKLYPFSSLHILSTGATPNESLSSPRTQFNSPGFVTPCTPLSIDSGISVRTRRSSSNTVISPGIGISKKTFHLHSLAPPPLPPEEQAPPLPPQDSITPPPLPPLPPTGSKNSAGGGVIENISSDEESGGKEKEPVSPPSSPKSDNKPSSNSYSSLHTFDPSLGLKTLLATQSTGPALSSSPLQLNSNYELEVEEISGDESPVMVYFKPLTFESVSDDNEETVMEVGGEDMEVCSDDDTNVIEVNVRATQVYPTQNQLILPPSIVPHQFPPRSFFQQGPFILPPPGFLSSPPLPLPHHPHSHIPLCHGNILPPRSINSTQKPSHPFIKDHPSSRLHSLNGFTLSPHRYTPSSRLLRNFPSPRTKQDSISHEVLLKAIEQLRKIVLNDVQKRIVENSAYPVLDSHWEKRQKEKQAAGVASAAGDDSANTAPDKEKPSKPLEPYRRMLPGMTVKTDPDTQTRELDMTEGSQDEDEREESSLPTPRKRLMNFKIPLVNRGAGERRGQSFSVVATRRLFSGEEETLDKVKSGQPPSKSAQGFYEYISSSENFSSGSEDEGERSSDEENGSWEESELSGEELSNFDKDKEYREIFGASSDSESNFEDFVANTKSNNAQYSQSDGVGDVSPDELAVTKGRRPAVKLKVKGRPKGKEFKDSKMDIDFVISDKDTDKADESKQVNKENFERESTIAIKKKITVPKPRYKRRTSMADDEICEEFAKNGPYKEDVQMFKMAYLRLREDGNEIVDGVTWAHYPDVLPKLSTPLKTKRRRIMTPAECVDHTTGCARSEGYYKITMREKIKYLPHHRMKNSTTPAETKNKSSGRVNRANQRKLASLFSAGDISSDLAKYNQLKARKKQLKFAKSTIHNWGLFAMETIAADEMIIEYVGQMVRQAVADEREKRYEAAGIGSSYLFRVDHDYIIDATRSGNLARFINHCCDPNCYAKVINAGNLKKIIIYSKRDIALGEEITYDYKFPIEDEKIPCLCGAPMCRGTLN